MNGTKSQTKEVVSRVPQALVLGLLLFLILFSNVDEEVSEFCISSFPINTRTGYPIGDPDDIARLQTNLNSIFKWAHQNNMKFNIDKFECVSMS